MYFGMETFGGKIAGARRRRCRSLFTTSNTITKMSTSPPPTQPPTMAMSVVVDAVDFVAGMAVVAGCGVTEVVGGAVVTVVVCVDVVVVCVDVVV